MPTKPTTYRAPRAHLGDSTSPPPVRAYDLRRGSSSARGYTWRWQQYSRAFRAAHPMCSTKGCTQPAEHVDHIIDVHGPDDPLFWEPSNHQGLCHSCHSRKPQKRRGINRAAAR